MVYRKHLIYLGGFLVLTGLGLAFYVLIAYTSGLPGTSPSGIGLNMGQVAPDFSLPELSGEDIRLSNLRGKPVVINFWATWCAPCVIEMPNLQDFYEIYASEFEILAVDADEPAHVVEQFINERGVTFRVLLDPGARIQDLYRIRGYPTTYFVDSNGLIQAQHIGMLTKQQIADYLLQLGIGP